MSRNKYDDLFLNFGPIMAIEKSQNALDREKKKKRLLWTIVLYTRCEHAHLVFQPC
jgi:hypothetical protein